MWEIAGQPAALERFKPFEVTEILYEFDGPRIFTLEDADGELCLAYWSDSDKRYSRYVVVPTALKIVKGLRSGRISVFDALDQSRCWLCDITHNGDLASCIRVNFDDVPRDALPVHSTMLLPSLEPLLALRAVGDVIVPGRIPGSAVRAVVEGAQRAFKVLSEYVLGQTPHRGRPKEFMSRLFDLPMQRLAFNSLEVSFRMPIEEVNLFASTDDKSPEIQTLEEVATLLNKGLKWLATSASEEGIYSPEDPDESAVVLRALKELTPSSHGSIERLELRGQVIGSRTSPWILKRNARRRVTSAIRSKSLEPQPVEFEGRIRELDKDRLSFELREISNNPTLRFVFDEELLEEVFQAFDDDKRVKVTGMTFPVKNITYALAVSRIAESNLSPE